VVWLVAADLKWRSAGRDKDGQVVIDFAFVLKVWIYVLVSDTERVILWRVSVSFVR
jgi:hypothetical protein